MALATIETNLDVITKFECLMRSAVGSESVYIRTKETLTELFKEYSMSSADRAGVLSNILGSFTSSVTASAMQLALQWAGNEKDLALKKEELAAQIANMAADKDVKEGQRIKLKWEAIALQAESIRVMGKYQGLPTKEADYAITGVSDTGKVFTDMALSGSQKLNLDQERTVLLPAKEREIQASVQKILADSITNYGPWSYPSLTIDGFDSFAGTPTRYNDTTIRPLSEEQRIIAREQAKGYAYNAWGNAATASAGAIGTLLAGGMPVTDVLNTILRNTMEALRDVELPDFPVTP